MSVLLVFWYGLTYNVKDKLGSTGHLGLVLTYFSTHYFMVPQTIAFAFVSSLLILTVCIGNLTKRESVYYNSESLANIPIVMMAFVEGFACDAFLKHVGGHVWYDVTIPLVLTAYFIYHKRNT